MKFQPLKLVVFAATLVFVAASPTPSDKPEDRLSSAGFKPHPAQTAEQKKQLKALPDRKICEVKQNGKRYYVYADKKHNQVYMGTEASQKRFHSGLKQGANGYAITKNVYDNRGYPIQVNTFSGFGPLGQ